MAPENYDRHFRSKVYHLETEVPPYLWDQIDEKLRPRRRPFPIWWLGLVAVGSLVLTMLFWPQVPKEVVTKSPISKQHSTQLKDQEFSAPSTQDEDELDAIHRSSGKRLSINDGQKQSRSSIRNLTAQSDVYTRTKSNPSEHNATSGTMASIQNEERQPGLPNQTANRLANFLPSKEEEKQRRHDLDHLTLLPNQTSQLFDRKRLLGLRSDPEINLCPSFGGRTLMRPFVEFSIGGGVPLRQLSVLIPEVSDYQALRENTEKVRGLVSVSGLIGVDIGKHFEVKSGLSFTQLNEVFDYVDQSASRTVSVIVTDTITVDGVRQILSDTSVVTEYGQRIKLTNNYFRFLDIPILGGYRWRMGKHSLLFQGGAAVNLALWKEVDLLAPDGTIVNADSKNPNAYPAFRSSTGVDLLAEVGYIFDITDQNLLRIIASVRHPLQSISHESYPLSQKYTQVKLGLSWKHYLW